MPRVFDFFSFFAPFDAFILGAAQVLTFAVPLQGEKVDKMEAEPLSLQEIGQVPPVVIGGLHPEEKMISLSFSPSSLHLLQEALETLTGVGELESDKHLSSQIHNHTSVLLLSDIDSYQERVRPYLSQPFCGTIEHVGVLFLDSMALKHRVHHSRRRPIFRYTYILDSGQG